MPTPERGLITALIDDGCVGEHLPHIRTKWFFDQYARRAWLLMQNHWNEYRETMSRKLLKEELPGFPFETYDADPRALMRRVEDKFLRNKLLKITDLVSAQSGEDVRDALSKATVQLNDLRATITRRIDGDIASTMDEAFERYVFRRDHKGKLGIPFPWAPMQRSTYGAQNGGYYLFYGRQKSMKTWLLLTILMHWYYHFRRKILIVTREMTVQQIQDRMLCLFAGLDYGRFLAGELAAEEESLLEEAAEAVQEIGNLHVETVEGHGAAAAQHIANLADMYDIGEGDVIGIDGLYFYSNSEWTSFASFSRTIKQIFLDRLCVGVCTSQANRNFKGTMQADAGVEMGMGDAPVQDCDAAVKIRLDAQEEHLHMVMSTLREGKPAEWTINARPAYDFTVKYSDAPDKDGNVDTKHPTVKPKLKVQQGKIVKVRL